MHFPSLGGLSISQSGLSAREVRLELGRWKASSIGSTMKMAMDLIYENTLMNHLVLWFVLPYCA